MYNMCIADIYSIINKYVSTYTVTDDLKCYFQRHFENLVEFVSLN